MSLKTNGHATMEKKKKGRKHQAAGKKSFFGRAVLLIVVGLDAFSSRADVAGR